jgi:pyridinium-3,5-biscarboxylic acid mononucleotide sulfurtransferase
VGKWISITDTISKQGRAAVAFSGGVDSALLLKLCADALGPDCVLALTAVSELQPRRELDAARAIAKICGVRLMEVRVNALDAPNVAANPKDRCYHCKRAVFGALLDTAQKEGFPVLMDGSNASDRGDWRPGKKAAAELGVLSPFDLADITKDEIRAKSNELGLPNWSAPAAACLATRIPTGTPLTAEALRMVEKAEDALIALGFPGCRVRLHGSVARIEAPKQYVARMAADDVRLAVIAALKPLEFDFVTLDLEGYRMGSMN